MMSTALSSDRVRTSLVSLVTLAALPVLAACGGDAGTPSARAGEASSSSTFNVSLATVGESGVQGLVTVSPGQDSVILKMELMGLEGGTTYPAFLYRGTCDSPGERVRALERPTAGAIGIGSATTLVAGETLADGPLHIQAHLPDETPAACGDLPTGRL